MIPCKIKIILSEKSVSTSFYSAKKIASIEQLLLYNDSLFRSGNRL